MVNHHFMTTLFNLFAPSLLWVSSAYYSVVALSSLGLSLVLVLLNKNFGNLNKIMTMFSLNPSTIVSMILVACLAFINLMSLVVYNYPVSTTLGFNLSVAMVLWLTSILIQMVKLSPISSLLPGNTPWYLISFLSLVELVSIGVRPITLCFRLLANMSAGHILLTLICKLPNGLWSLGTMFGLLELMVSMVQAFVFLMLVSVYLEEAITH